MKKRLLILNLISILSIGYIYSQCPSGDITFEYQWEIEEFALNYPNCTEINGNLNIGNQTVYAITSLLPLNNLTTVTGRLRIQNVWGLNSLSGLENINSVGELWVGYNFSENLTSLVGLEGLETVNGNITIGYNDGLTTLSGLDNLQTVSGDVWLAQLPALTSISSLNSLYSIDGSLIIQSLNSLTSLNAYQSLISINNSLSIDMTSLSSIDGFMNLQTINGFINIRQNNYLSDISNLQSVSPDLLDGLNIMNNPLLAVCSLSNICTYLTYDSIEYPRDISNNLGDCIDESAVINACNNLSVSSRNLELNFKVFTTNNSLHIYSEDFDLEKVNIYDISGKLIYTKFKTEQESIIISNIGVNRLLIVKAYSKDGNISFKKIVT